MREPRETISRRLVADVDCDGFTLKFSIDHPEFGPPKLLIEANAGQHVSGFTLHDPNEAELVFDALEDSRSAFTEACAEWEAKRP